LSPRNCITYFDKYSAKLSICLTNGSEQTEHIAAILNLAGKIWGGEKLEDFVDIVDDICGIGE